MKYKIRTMLAVLTLGLVFSSHGQDQEAEQLTVKQIMNDLIVPASNTIWGAYQLQGDEQWLEIRQAGEAMLAAGELLSQGGSAEGERAMAAMEEWRLFNGQMLEASRKVLVAVEARDEEALSAAGNDDLYPPCESCHRRFQNQ